MMLRTLAAAAILLGAHTAAQADVYRWVDADGRVQYSDRWIPGSVLVKVDKTRNDPAAAAAAQARTNATLATSNQRIADDKAKNENLRAVKKDVAQAQAGRCKELTEAYDKAVRAQHIYRTGKDGQREFVPAADAEAYRAQLRADKQTACGAGAK
jgi:multidrug resistance efflux pump